jgi:hypothetical protein
MMRTNYFHSLALVVGSDMEKGGGGGAKENILEEKGCLRSAFVVGRPPVS